ncbi:hypothetical protein SANTM175S_04872 [Streptomyces antimycoticus]
MASSHASRDHTSRSVHDTSEPTEVKRKWLNSGLGTSARAIRTPAVAGGSCAGLRSEGAVCSRCQVVTVMLMVDR